MYNEQAPDKVCTLHYNKIAEDIYVYFNLLLGKYSLTDCLTVNNQA